MKTKTNEIVKAIIIFFLILLTIIAFGILMCPNVIGKLSERKSFDNVIFYLPLVVSICTFLLIKTLDNEISDKENDHKKRRNNK